MTLGVGFMTNTAAHHLGAMFWLCFRGAFMLSVFTYSQWVCINLPVTLTSKQMLRDLTRIIYSRGRPGRGIYIFTLPETLADFIHNTFTGPEHNFHQECIVLNDTNVGYLMSDYMRNVGNVSSNSVCVATWLACVLIPLIHTDSLKVKF